MRKLNSKGFLLVETLLVAIFIISTLMFLYTQFSKVRDSYKQSFNYNTVTGLYSAGTFLDYLQDSGIEKLDNAVKSSPFVDLTGCDSVYIKSNAICEKLKGELNIKKIYFTKSDPANFKNDLVSQNLDREFKEFIHTIKAPDVATGGRLIVEYNDNTFATVLAEIKKTYLTSFSSSADDYFKESTYKTNIKNVYFVDYVDTTNALKTYDLSEDKDESITGWIVANTSDTSKYDLYIGSEKNIYTKNFAYAFYGMTGIEKIQFSNLNTSENTSLFYTFDSCSKLKTLDLRTFDTSKVTSMAFMFDDCKSLTTLDVSNFDTSKVTNMSYMFGYCNSLTTLDVSSFDTSIVTSMSSMFENCKSLTTLDVSHFNTSKVTSMAFMFGDCKSLTTLDVSNFDTSKVTNISYMFENCNSLTTLDVSSFDTSNVTGMYSMFKNCNSLTTLDVSNFDTSNVTNMSSMFGGCNSLTTLDVSHFDTSKVTDMQGMFGGCNSLTTLDVSHFDTSKVIDMFSMFYNCNSLTTLYASNKFTTSAVTDSSYMFSGCTNLVGGAGTKYDENKIDKTYARIDGGTSNPGYFTEKS